MRSWLVGYVTAVLLAAGIPAHADLVNHVRVILDTSASMKGYGNNPANDPGRLAVLSTVLLHDLVKPQIGKSQYLSGSFAVIPFAHSLNWTSSGNPPVVSIGLHRLLGSEATDRAKFINGLSEDSMPRTALHTFYAPYIAKALQDIPAPAPQDSEATTRTIVLITDGLTENAAGDKAYMSNTLLEQMHQTKTRLYVLFFASDPVLLRQGEAFFEEIWQADQANISQGKYKDPVFPERAFAVQRGDALPGAMVRLFSRAYGYVHEPDDQKRNVSANPPAKLDLAKTYNPEEAVVVALRLSFSGIGPNPPTQDIRGPGGSYINTQAPRPAGELGGSFSAVWVEQPVPQLHELAITDGAADYVFVLRPTKLRVDLREFLPLPSAPQNRPCFDSATVAQALSQGQERFETMANTECWIDFLVGSAAGNAQGLPQNLKVTFRVKERLGAGDFRGIGSVDGTAVPGANKRPITNPQQEGQRFYYWTNFEDKRPSGSAPRKFKAEVTVHVNLGDATVAFRGDDNPFRVDVYPLIAVEPDPPEQPIPMSASALQRDESAETVFNLKEIGDGIVEGVHVNKADPFGDHDYMLQAYLAGRDANGNPQPGPPLALKGATFELDGKTICFEQGGAASSCDWDQAVALKRNQLFCRGSDCTLAQPFVHKLAVKTGKHDSGDPLNPAVIDVHFRLRHPPYDHFRVIRPFAAKVYVAEHPGLSLWALLPFLLLLLGLLAPLTLLRPRFALPKDLSYGLATTANPHNFKARRLPSASPMDLMFSRKAERVVTDRDGELLGWIRPTDDELYSLRTAPGVDVVDAQGKVLESKDSGVTLLQVRQAYRLRRGIGDLMFRMEYL